MKTQASERRHSSRWWWWKEGENVDCVSGKQSGDKCFLECVKLEHFYRMKTKREEKDLEDAKAGGGGWSQVWEPMEVGGAEHSGEISL